MYVIKKKRKTSRTTKTCFSSEFLPERARMRPAHRIDSSCCRRWVGRPVRRHHRPQPRATPAANSEPSTAPPAGIPTCAPLTPAGNRLMAALMAGSDVDAFVQDALRQAETAGAAGATGGGDDDANDGALSPARVAAEAVLTDIVYAVALASAYLWTDGVLQAAWRGGSVGTAPPPAFRPTTLPAVLLPPGAGAYSLGSFAFERVEGADPAGGVTWGGALSAAAAAADGDAGAGAPPSPALEDVVGSAAADALLRDEGDTPARLDVDGAARTFRLYLSWGYSRSPAFRPAVLAGEHGQPKSGAARRAADRHVGALFGGGGHGGATITTLARWRHMTCEARRYGGALADAEGFVLGAAARK